MEGGTEFDLKSLDEEDPLEEGNVQSGTSPARSSNNVPAASASAVTTKDASQDDKGLVGCLTYDSALIVCMLCTFIVQNSFKIGRHHWSFF